MAEWNRHFPSSTPGIRMSPPSAHSLSPEQLEAITKPFRGLGIEIEAPEPASFLKRTPSGIPADDGPTLLVTERDITVKGIRLKRREAQ